MVIDMESYRTESTALTGEVTKPQTCSGPAGSTTASAIPARSLPLSAAEAFLLARIRHDRERGYMVSSCDVDFLLELLGRL
jgi:hypothetical protein